MYANIIPTHASDADRPNEGYLHIGIGHDQL